MPAGMPLTLVRGAFALAGCAYEWISESQSLPDAARSVMEAAGALLPVRGVSLELPMELSRAPLCFPSDFPDEADRAAVAEEIVYLSGSRRLVTLRIFWQGVRPRGFDAEHDLAFVRFMIVVLGHRAGNYLALCSRVDSLSNAERRVSELLHLSEAEILERLRIEKSTLETHLKRIYRKLGVHRRRDALDVLAASRPGDGSAAKT